MKATFLVKTRAARGLPARLRPVLDALGERLGIAHCAVSLLLTDDDGIADLNERFRGKAEATDVLSFPSGGGDRSSPGHHLGDLAISVERATLQAREHGHGVADEVEVLALHGVLHLLGHDHETDAGEMRALEAELAKEILGGARGLTDRAQGPPRGRRE